MEQGKVYIHHVRVYGDNGIVTNGGVTLAMEMLEDNSVQISTSYCSLLDNYNRRLGKSIVLGRREHGNVFYSELISTDVDAFLSHIIAIDPSPQASSWKKRWRAFIVNNGATLRRKYGNKLTGL